MSPDELEAKEVRRLTREAGAALPTTMEANWETNGAEPPTTKTVAIQIDPGSAPVHQDTIRFSQGSAFLESVVLSVAVYRSLAGGIGATESAGRFQVHAGGAGYDRVTVDTASLAALVTRERPAFMARARRLLAAEQRSLQAQRLSIEQKIALFEEQWDGEDARQRIDTATKAVASRTMLMMSGKDHVALWVRVADFAGSESVLASPLAAAIVPRARKLTRSSIFSRQSGEQDTSYLDNTFGSGAERTLVLDMAKLRVTLPALTKEARDLAMTRLEDLIARNSSITEARKTKASATAFA